MNASDRPTPSTELAVEPGDRVGHYELVAELGRGGMGVVYEARDLVLGRHVALKTPLFGGKHDSSRLHRFMRETLAASKVSHPGIVSVFEAFEHQGRPWFAMELVEGETLSSLLGRKGRIPVADALDHLETLAAALSAAHAKGILHRDIKPSNILITSDGLARITDFGLAHLMAEEDETSAAGSLTTETLTGDGLIVGTLPYVAPEQLLGRKVDERSDIFSLGVVFYEMCTGRRVFDGGDRGKVIDSILHLDPPALDATDSDIPGELNRIIQKCLSKSPNDRYQSAQELRIDLRWLRRHSGSGETPHRLLPHRNKRFYVFALILVVAVVVAVSAIIIRGGYGRGPSEMVARKITDRAGLEEHPAISPNGDETAYCVVEDGNKEIWISDNRGGHPLRLTDDLSADHSPAWFPEGEAIAFVSDRSGIESIWKVPRFGGSPVPLVERAFDPAVSPDGRSIAFARPHQGGFSRIWIADLAGGDEELMITSDDQGLWDHRNPAWAPDGRSLCYNDFKNLWLVDLEGRKARLLTEDDPPDTEPVWSPDGRYIYFTSYRAGAYALWRVTVASGELVQVTMGMGPEQSPSLSRDGGRMAYTTKSEASAIVLVDRQTGETRRIDEARFITEPEIAPDRSEIVFVSARENAVGLWKIRLVENRPTGPPIRLTEHRGSSASPSYSPDGRWIAYHRVLDGQRDIWVIPAVGGTPHRLTDHPAADIIPDWSPDGSTIAFSSDRGGSMQLWAVPFVDRGRGGEAFQITGLSGTAAFATWSPDGSVIIFVHFSEDEGDIWWVSSDGESAPQRLTIGAQTRFLGWDQTANRPMAVGLWDGLRPTIRYVDLATGNTDFVEHATPSTPLGMIVDFDLSRDGRLLALNEQEQRGDVWVLETEPSSF